MLFCLYVGGLLRLLKEKTDIFSAMFGDSLPMAVRKKTDEEIIDKTKTILDTAQKWAAENDLVLHAHKTKVAMVRRSSSPAT